MSSCEKYWHDSGGDSVVYEVLLAARKDEPCTSEEQAGQWWDPIRKIDTRITKIRQHKFADNYDDYGY